ncbi:hypothetical protein EAF04_005551 [Stromatinia cepivora]|nr:hypothetical protein EAF04_005551 [Stromatinia cepivora]
MAENDTSITISAEPCLSTNELSNGSAAFIVVSLMLGLLAQPRGSLVLFHENNGLNIWRFSPFLRLFEVFVIIFYILRGIIMKIPHRDVIYLLMLKRIDGSTPRSNWQGRLPQATRDAIEKPRWELTISMVLQLVKVCSIRNSPLTQILALIYWSNWVCVQYIHCALYLRATNSNEVDEILKTDGTHIIPRLGIFLQSGSLCEQIAATIFMLVSIGNGSVLHSTMLSIYYGVVMIGDWMLYILRRILSARLQQFILSKWRVYVTAATSTIFMQVHKQSLALPVCVAVYFKFYYDSTGTYKPAWLDWIG